MPKYKYSYTVDLSALFTDVLNLVDQLEVDAAAEADKIEDTYRKKFKKEAKFMADGFIEDFYSSYNPRYYSEMRTYDLYNAYKIDVATNWSITYSPSYMKHSHHQQNEIIFNNVFLEGYHGGSRGTDRHGVTVNVPSWRTPHPSVAEDMGVPVYNWWSTREVARSDSPYNKIEHFGQILIDDLEKEMNDKWNKYLKDKIDVINKKLTEIMKIWSQWR